MDDGNHFGSAETYINPYKLEYAGTHAVPIRIYTPTSASGPFPVLFWVHGGGWSGGTPTNSIAAQVDPYLCEHLGVVLVGVAYRCLGSGGVFSEGLQDVMDAVAYMRSNAAIYNIDTNRIGLYGGSAGTPLASLAAQLLPEAKCFIGYNGIYNFVSNPGSGFPGSTSYRQNVPSLAANSAIYNLRSNPPAVLLLHGTADTTISNSQSVLFGEAVAAQHSYAKVCLYEGEEHAFFNYAPLDLITLYEVKEHVRKFLLAPAPTKVWMGGQSGNAWNYSAANWMTSDSAAPGLFADNDLVLFDNRGATNSTVNLATSVSPWNMTVDSSSNYVFAGAGRITGSGGLTKLGTGLLKLSSPNSYSGGTVLSGGAIYLASAQAAGSGTITLNSGHNGFSAVNAPVTLTNNLDIAASTAFFGISGGGGATFGLCTNLTVTGNVNLGGTTKVLSIRTSQLFFSGPVTNGGVSFDGNKSLANQLTLSGTNTYSDGTTVTNGGTLNLNSPTALGTGALILGGSQTLTLNNTSGGNITLLNSNAQSWNRSLTFAGTRNLNLGQGSVTLGANVTLTTSASILTVDGPIGDGGGAYSLIKAGAGTLVLSGASTFTNSTTVSAGTLLVNGSLASRSTLVNAGTLGGGGTIGGALTVAAGGTLQPGLGGTDTSSLAVSGNASLSGATVIRLNRANAQNASRLVTAGALANGGTLTVTNAGGPPQGGDSFTIFTVFGATSGSFSATNLPPLGAGTNWWITVRDATNVVLLVNQALVAGAATYNRIGGLPINIPITNLLSNVSDADGDIPSLVRVSSTTNGVTLTTDENYIYVPANNVADAFTYTVTDRRGATNSGMVIIAMVTGYGQETGAVSVAHSTVTAQFAGTAGLSYIVQRGTNVLFSGWVSNFPAIIAPLGGVFSVTDDFNDIF